MMETDHSGLDGLETLETDDHPWKERFGIPPPTKKQYVSWKTCSSFWAWLSYSWCFVNAQGYREIGRRFLGRETIRYYVIPRGELRF